MLLIIALSTLIFSIILIVFNWRINKNALYLSFSFISISVYCITHYLIVYAKNPFWITIFYNHFAPLNLVVGPFLYFYVRGTLTDRSRLKKYDWVHFIPAILHFIGFIPWFFLPFKEKLGVSQQIANDVSMVLRIKPNFILPAKVAYILRPVLFLSYCLYSFIDLWKFSPFKNQGRKIPHQQFILSYRWLIILLTTMTLLSLNFTLMNLQFIGSKPDETLIFSSGLHIITGSILGIMSITLLFFPQVLYGLPTYTKQNDLSTPRVLPNPTHNTDIDSQVEEEKNPFEELAARIQDFLQEEKPFKNPNFSLESVAQSLNVPLNHVSYCFSEIIGIKFTALRQQLRIEYAKELLKSNTTSLYTIEGIAHNSGFSNRSSFYNAFKAETGITPTEFIAQYHSSNPE